MECGCIAATLHLRSYRSLPVRVDSEENSKIERKNTRLWQNSRLDERITRYRNQVPEKTLARLD